MAEVETGYEQFADEDRLYAGSRFRDVVDALFANPYQKVWGREGGPPLPSQEQTIRPGSAAGCRSDRRRASSTHRRVRSTPTRICVMGRTEKGSRDCCIPTACA